ncbi:hypothetical protein [Shewanella algae]|uniref:hypothetical protein n=1 Tax=Shewanella algae TaxID=38313 RepID=UPI0016565663|nr:hypothetical protein [Shewanella algae]MBC8795517.1 hypothetical protein [Shewanella algae]MBO2597806.1 hypothetical protein [Shewanella algae]
MNLKNSLLFCCILFSAPLLASNALQRYQQLQFQLQRDPAAALKAIESFQRQYAEGSDSEQQMAAYLHLQACISLKDYQCAAQQTRLLLALPVTPLQQRDLYKLGAQLNYQQSEYRQSLEYSKQWLQLAANLQEQQQEQELKPGATEFATMHSLASYAEFQLQHLPKATEQMRLALDWEVTETRQHFLQSLYQRQQRLPEEEQLLRQMIAAYPDRPLYWERLGHNLQQQGQEQESLNVLSSAYKAGQLPTRSIPLLAQLLMLHQAPGRAADLLEQHSEALAQHSSYKPLLSQAYLLSRQRDKALNLLQKSSQTQGQKSLPLRAQLAYSLGQWPLAQQLLSQLRQQDADNRYWQLLLALSHYEAGQLQQAKTLLKAINQGEYQTTAAQWLNQINYLTDAP